MNRSVPTDSELETAIQGVTTEWIQAGKTFTAYDVTIEARRRNPSVEIRHDDHVRDIVLDSILAAGYEVEWRDFNGTVARTYMPPAKLGIVSKLIAGIGKLIPWKK